MQQGELRCGGSGGAAAGAARRALPGCAVTLLLQTRPLSLSVFLDDLAFNAVLQPSCFHCSMQPLLTIHLFPANMRLPTLAALVLPPLSPPASLSKPSVKGAANTLGCVCSTKNRTRCLVKKNSDRRCRGHALAVPRTGATCSLGCSQRSGHRSRDGDKSEGHMKS